MLANTANGPDCWKCSLHVEWHDCSWCPSIALRQGIASRQGTPARPLPDPTLFPHPVRRQNLAKPMNLIGNRKPKIGNSPAFTLVELLTVIAIIGILAAMLLTALPAAITAAKKARAKTEIAQIVNAIEAYDSAYSRFPISPAEQTAAAGNDFTTGYIANPQANIAWPGTPIGSGFSYDNNSNVVAVLMDLTTFAVNAGHQKNPKQTKFLNAKQVSDNTLPGVGTDGVYRDPWGNPYVITMDLSYDELCKDWFYCLNNVSGYNKTKGNPGLNGLTNPDLTKDDNFQFHGKVMVWSAGPDKKVDPAVPANQGANKDNILSWQ
jgi:prepilin-type N-terminal cleavage/methylation domain-containing protein